jgi:low-affinity ferrous iron transport protein
MSAAEQPGPLRRALRAVGISRKLVSNNIYTDIQSTASFQAPSRSVGNDSESEWDGVEIGVEIDKTENDRRDSRNPISTRIFDSVTKFAGTAVVLFLTIALLVLWLILGLVLGTTQTWQIVLQNTSSIQCYISDTLLMRQQHNHSRGLLTMICNLRSRNATYRRIVMNLRQRYPNKRWTKGSQETIPEPIACSVDDNASVVTTPSEHAIQNDGLLPARNLYDRICDPLVWTFGSLYTSILYWAGIIVWIGFGNQQQWGNNWQLYINTATAAEITFISIFLQNTRQRHMNYLRACSSSISELEWGLECKLRELSNDLEPNPTVSFDYDYKVENSRGNRAIDWYAAIVGSGVGLAISTAVFVVWVAIGSPMQWNANWWLIIGTYTGLVGFIDGFVLRNVYFRGAAVVDDAFGVLQQEDADLCELLGLHLYKSASAPQLNSLQNRIGSKIGVWCSKSLAVLGSVLVVILVLCIATGMHWSETGQLICNTPTMIVEGFLLLVLIQAHSMTNLRLRHRFHDILMLRMALNERTLGLFVQDNEDHDEKTL